MARMKTTQFRKWYVMENTEKCDEKKPLCMKASYEFEHRRTRQIYSQLEGFQSPFQTELISWTLRTYCWNNKNESNTFRTDVNNGSDLV